MDVKFGARGKGQIKTGPHGSLDNKMKLRQGDNEDGKMCKECGAKYEGDECPMC